MPRTPPDAASPGRPRARSFALVFAAAAVLASAGVFAAAPASSTPLVARLSLSQLAGQRVIYAYTGLQPPPALLDRIRAGEAAGVIFFAPNVSSDAQLHAVIGELQAVNAASPVHAPLLMMTDQEGGLVRRLSGPPVLSQKQIGASPQAAALAGAAGAQAAANLLAVGIQVNLAPVLDVFAQAGNFIDRYQRSYSSNPATVALLARAFISAQQHGGVAATAKHFPGLGAATASQDTDTGPVTINRSLSSLRAIDELPYRAAIAAAVKLVMVSWATYPALDGRLPAGLSATVIGGELRGRLGFRGVTITDGLGAGALASYGGFGARGLTAARAGADLLLCTTTNPYANSPANGVAALDALRGALSDKGLSRASAEQAAARVIALRQSL